MSDETHAWFRRRLPTHAAGLLDEAEERRFLEHRAQCEDCRLAFDEFTTSDEAALTERGAHIPAAMLARWPAARRELAGLERAMVREHLSRCIECRGDLERAGHSPDLEHVAGLEMSPRPLDWRSRLFGRLPRSGAAREAEPPGRAYAGAGPRVRREVDRPGRAWVPWVVGGWATVATAAAITLAVVPRAPQIGGERRLPPPASATVPAVRETYSLESLSQATRLRTPLRGASGATTTIAVRGDARFVQVSVGPLDLPQGQQLEAEVLAGTETLLRRPIARREAGGVTVLFGPEDAPLAAGDYRLRLVGRAAAVGGSPGPDTVEFRFRIVRHLP